MKFARSTVLAAGLMAMSCVGARAIPPVERDGEPLPGLAGEARSRVVSAARTLVGQKKVVVAGRRYGNDCTSLMQAIFAPVGVQLRSSSAVQHDNGVTAMWRFVSAHGRVFTGGRPLPGDLVFFRETYDQNRDGRLNDGLTHVGVVEDVELDGTVIFIHRVSQGVVRHRMNLNAPHQLQSAQGKKLNDWLRAAGKGQEPQLTAELFFSFATLLPVEAQLSTR